MQGENRTNRKSLIKRVFDILGYTFLILMFTIGTGCLIYEAYLYYKLNKGTISISEKKYLDEQREMARLLWDN